MITPITDAAAYPPAIFQDHVELVPADLARLLELDRATLMEALERVNEHMRNRGVHLMDPARVTIDEALSTARANFPTP